MARKHRVLSSLVLAAAAFSCTICHSYTFVRIEAGDEQALRDAIAGANSFGVPLNIQVIGDEPFVFDSSDNDVAGGNFLPVIESSTKVALFNAKLEVAEGGDQARFFFVEEEAGLMLIECSLSGGTSSGDGGAVLVDGNLTLVDTTLTNNVADGDGGAIQGTSSSSLRFLRSKISDNQAGGSGGGVSVLGRLDGEHTVYTRNRTDAFGGAVDCSDSGGQVDISHSILSGNSAGEGAGCGHFNGCPVSFNNVLLTGCDGDGLWASASLEIDNSLMVENTPSNCQIFGPALDGEGNAADDDSCGSGEGITVVNPPGWSLDQIESTFGDLPGPGAPPALIDDFLTGAELTGEGSSLMPGEGPGACGPIGINGFPVIPPAAPCTPGPFQYPAEGDLPGQVSGQIYDPVFRGTGINLIDSGGGVHRADFLTYGPDGQPLWYSSPGHAAGPFLVFPAVPRLPVAGGQSSSSDAYDLVVTPVSACVDSTPSRVRVFDSVTDQRVDMEGLYLTQVIECPDSNRPQLQVIQDGHSGGFKSTDRPADRLSLFILSRGEALMNWMTVDDEGRPRWYVGVGPFDGDSIEFDSLYATSGPAFPDAYDPADLAVTDAGLGTLTFSGCDELEFEFDLAELGAVEQAVLFTRDLNVNGTDCSPEQ